MSVCVRVCVFVQERRLHTGAGPIGAHGARRLRRRQSLTHRHMAAGTEQVGVESITA